MFKHWTRIDFLWLFLATVPMMFVGIVMGDSWISLISSLTGVLYVILCAKGKLVAYGFGVVNCCLYAYLSYTVGLYGETLLNLFYYIPLQAVGFLSWRKEMDVEKGEVIPRMFQWRGRICLVLCITIATLCLGYLLQYFKGATPYADAFTTVASIVAMTLTASRYMEQWPLWFAINALSVYLWVHRYLAGAEHIATLLMWVVFLLCAIYGYVKWRQRLPKSHVALNRC